jgi:hypothetical protein
MPVVALDPSNTARYFYDYSIGGDNHSMLVRVTEDVGLSDAALAIDAFLTAIEPGCNEFVTVGLRFAALGSNITNPVDSDPIQATYGSGVMPVINRPLQVTFTGRSGDGHKARVGLFAWDAQTDDTWRYSVGENATVIAAIAALGTAGAGGIFCSISGERVLWHPYMNIGFNDHWVKEARG